MPDGTVLKGLTEKAVLKEKNDTVQFERVGFVKLEKRSSSSITAIFTHR